MIHHQSSPEHVVILEGHCSQGQEITHQLLAARRHHTGSLGGSSTAAGPLVRATSQAVGLVGSLDYIYR